MSTTPSRRPRPHPARRARKIAGSLSVASLLFLTGCMVATTKTSTGTPTASAGTTTTSPATATGDDSTATSRSTSAAAVAAAPATQLITSTHAS